MQLSKHFSEKEFLSSRIAIKRGITNTWTSEQHRANAVELCNRFLEPIRAVLQSPIVITSGYRRPELNQLVGGVPDSAHVEGCAVDFIVPGKDIKTVYDIIRKMRTDNILPRYDQLIYEHGSWIHLGISSDRPRAQNLRAFTNGGKVVYAPYVPGFEK